MTMTQINGLPCPAVLYFLQWFLSRTLQKQDKDELFTSDWFRISKPPTLRSAWSYDAGHKGITC